MEMNQKTQILSRLILAVVHPPVVIATALRLAVMILPLRPHPAMIRIPVLNLKSDIYICPLLFLISSIISVFISCIFPSSQPVPSHLFFSL